MMNIMWAHVISGFSEYGLGSADLVCVLMFSVALAGMMDISALFLCFIFQQAHPGRARGEMPGIPRPRSDIGTLLLLLYSSSQSKYKPSPKSRGGETVFTSLTAKSHGKGQKLRKK